MGFSEVLLLFVIALVVLGPQKLPKLVTQVGKWAGKARAMARQFREQLETEINLEELKSTQAKTPPPPQAPPSPSATTPEPWNTLAAQSAAGPTTEAPAPHADAEPAATAPLADAGLGSAVATEAVTPPPAPPSVSEAFEHTIHAPPPPPETQSSTPIVETHERGI